MNKGWELPLYITSIPVNGMTYLISCPSLTSCPSSVMGKIRVLLAYQLIRIAIKLMTKDGWTKYGNN